jgi:hypothetical protein
MLASRGAIERLNSLHQAAPCLAQKADGQSAAVPLTENLIKTCIILRCSISLSFVIRGSIHREQA